jgi:2'-hydroxyisoflavone reductase
MFIDARDLGEWYIRLLEDGVTGTFMALGPREPLTFKGLLDGIGEGVGSGATFTWVDTDFLLERGVRAYTHMPLWMPARGRNVGFNRFDLTRTLETGITYRPLPVTAGDTLEWHKTRPAEEQARLRAGITAEREAELLGAWHSRIA